MDARIRSLALAAAISMSTLPASADCGCGDANRPCVEETLATKAVPVAPPVTEQTATFSLMHCWDCGGLDSQVGLLFLLPLIGFSLIAVTEVLTPRQKLLSIIVAGTA